MRQGLEDVVDKAHKLKFLPPASYFLYCFIAQSACFSWAVTQLSIINEPSSCILDLRCQTVISDLIVFNCLLNFLYLPSAPHAQ